MPRMLAYDVLQAEMDRQHFRSLYYNSGAFGFPNRSQVRTVAWIGPEDPTIRPAAIPFVRRVGPPYESVLAEMAVSVWRDMLPGPLWLMPMSHWAFELGHGSRAWLPQVLQSIGVDPAPLDSQTTGSPIEFAPGEIEPLRVLTQQLLEHLTGSDFMLVFPSRPVLCTLHHHKQLWWQTTDLALYQILEDCLPPNSN